MFTEKYPYSDYNEFNLDWVIRKIRDIESSMTDYEALHSITFGGDWDISKQYQAWVIVSDPITHDGYLSLKPVPNNILLTDTNYWLKIADYTTGLANVNARVDAVENDITNNIDPAITAIENDITNNIDPAITAIENDITNNIKPDIDALKKYPRKILIFGDSYFMDAPPSGGTNFRTFLTSYITNLPNVSIDIKADGGEGFAQTGSYSFLYDVNNYTSVFDPDEVTDVFFVGGYNDRTHTIADIETGMATTFSAVKTKYPNARISVGHFGWDADLSSADRDMIVTVSLAGWHQCQKYGAGYMTNAEYTMHNYDLFYIVDNFHPNNDGHKELAKQIVNYIITGTCDVHYPFKQLQFNQGDPSLVASNTTSGYNIGFKLDNDQVTLYLPNDNILFTTDFDMDVLTYTQVLQFTTNLQDYRGYCIGMYDTATTVKEHIPMTGYIQTDTTFKDLASCNCILAGGFIHIRPYGIKADRSGFDTYTDVNAIHPIGGAVTIPTLSC